MEISRRGFLKLCSKLAAVGAATALSAGLPGCTHILKRKRPSFILVVIDCWRYDCFKPEVTPNICQLANRGIAYARYFANSGWTLSSVFAMLSGIAPKYTHRHPDVGYKRFHEDPKKPAMIDIGDMHLEKLPKKLKTIPAILKDAGYCTIHITQNPLTGRAVGYGGKQWVSLLEYPSTELRIGASQLIAKAVSELDGMSRGSDAFIYIHLMDAHYPYNHSNLSPESVELQRRYEETCKDRYGGVEFCAEVVDEVKDRYLDALGFVDSQLATLFDYVDGQLDEFVLMITADHGELFGEWGSIMHPGIMPSQILHVPMVVYDNKGRFTPKRDVRIRESIDIPATVAEMAGCCGIDGEGTSLFSRSNKDVVRAATSVEDAWITVRGEDLLL
ncbi:MAG TPA: twin-arginine translocation signal domain-containing protein, partial [Proteobacteria bacterium]|nr:twin-arginine translocation signal domain-containing protein [Pseudomonadota bacterium]